MELSTRYNPQETEAKWYKHWMDKNYFHSEPDEREPFTIVIPPPNVTGVLHMGHMLNNTIQDILIRKARLDGKNACWVPGTDHASIATEAKVVKMLRARGIKKSDISREEFMDYAFEWKEKYGGIILDQLQKLGASCDWKRTRFTMEPKMSAAVLKTFVRLYRKGKVYRGQRITNWDPEAKTVLSNEEVIYKEENSRLYHVRYQIEGAADEWITIATVRPETILGDTAIAIHPEDERYRHLKGRRALVPLINRSVPIIQDTYVEREFGTGALKITPAHDPNDYEIGQRHELEVVDVLNEDGTMSEAARRYIGEDRFKARKLIVNDLEAAGHIVKIEDYRNKVGRSERTDAIVEPRLTLQWFVDMKGFAKTALDAVESGAVKFHPGHFWNMFNSWLNEQNIRDWCISRQLWWGQRIPAWYYEDKVFVAETAGEALAQARKELGMPDLKIEDLHQDEDVLDTWFSSQLWPISVFDGFENQDELRYYYPTNVLVTAWDIIFFWVARMIMMGYEWAPELLGEEFVKEKGAQPFDHVYFTGMVRDSHRKKMSKSLGNSPDALELIDQYGADGVRFGLLSSAAAGNDIIFDAPFDKETKQILNESRLCEQGRNFCNKMWNALRLVKGWEVEEGKANPINRLAAEWMEEKLSQSVEKIEANFAEFRLSDTIMTLYKLIWDDFCSWYLEMVKPEYGQPIDRETYEETINLFERLMTVLHPFMPFVTEEIWHHLRDRAAGDDCIISRYPRPEAYDQDLINRVEEAKEVVTNVREVRNNKGIKMKEELKLYVQDTKGARHLLELGGLKEMIVKMANLELLEFTKEEIENSVSFLSGKDKFFLELRQEIDADEERERLQKELEYYQGFVQSVMKKLKNERFVNNAPAPVVEKERQKLADGESKIRSLEEALAQLGG
ncbi:MAG: valine--tRNA ligase [Phaeodactylibacter sp.]|nr:valine--tRNA ligase [Phaeodactylibacter sp.]MCB9294059.1 valine--tRNA ligase [Lewinellaceae bacterium]